MLAPRVAAGQMSKNFDAREKTHSPEDRHPSIEDQTLAGMPLAVTTVCCPSMVLEQHEGGTWGSSEGIPITFRKNLWGLTRLGRNIQARA